MSQPGLRLRVFEEKAEAGDWLRGLQRNLALPNGGEFCLFLLLLLLLLFLLLLVLSLFFLLVLLRLLLLLFIIIIIRSMSCTFIIITFTITG